MAEYGLFFTTNGIGDGVPYTSAQHFAWLQSTFGDGVCTGRGFELRAEVSGGNVIIKSGAAYSGGAFYENTSDITVTIPTPSIGTTGHHIVLRKSETAQTVRVALLSSSDGVASIPTVTQDANTWEFSLYTLTKTTAGVVTLTLTRRFIRPYISKRIGGSSLDWDVPGTSQYILGDLGIQLGVREFTLDGATQYTSVSETFPNAFVGTPLAVAGVTSKTVPVEDETTMAFVNTQVTASGLVISVRDFATTGTRVYNVAWYAFGPV
jgi:hypothetical protein